MNDPELMTAVRAVIDKQEIHDVLMRYCRGVDRRDRALIGSAFHPDAIDDHGTAGPATDLVDLVVNGTVPQMMHLTGNVLIELEGDTAYAESYFVSIHTADRDSSTFTRFRGGRYLDRFERRAGEWRIAYRMVMDEWARVDEISEMPAGIGAHHGERSRDDAVFHMRKLLRPA